MTDKDVSLLGQALQSRRQAEQGQHSREQRGTTRAGILRQAGEGTSIAVTWEQAEQRKSRLSRKTESSNDTGVFAIAIALQVANLQNNRARNKHHFSLIASLLVLVL